VADLLVSQDPSAEIESLYRTHGDRLWRAVHSYAGDPEVASDAVAEAFAQALRRGAAIRSPLPWIWRTAFRIASAELKERSGFTSFEESASSYELPEPVEPLLRALRELSPKQRASVVLYHYAGYQVNDVAKMLGSTGPAVRVHLYRARNRLRDLLKENIDA